ncbi:leucine efflux protein LeuE [Janthinobacterium agaricidamnosum]|uniref:LysE type translocator family protein n=1 Tax=Janthinobacterium agaricidamnosum NBRC 102515 = DSM 9628 TaxID=1349767 RepID=W0V211_9BURK|nr:leucine efflux protein LeuE [Janthinobacterium agaricidamnosum]CDG82864.1 lysE type translocator family protein [Janthinobacterium agaricidamnosum NBRC 102515 = DSM 9628]
MNALMHASFGIIDFWTYLLGTTLLIVLPGPSSMYILSLAARRGARQGYQGAAGISLGNIVLMLLSTCGVASLLKASPALFYVVKYIGAAYLCWIGLHMMLSCWRSLRGGAADTPDEAAQHKERESAPFRKALVIGLMNPKAILFFISFVIQFVDPHFSTPALSFAMLGLVAEIINWSYMIVLILIGARLAEAFRRRRRLSTSMAGGVGAMFIGFGAKLASATL